MGVQRDEDFITEFVFVPLYNRLQTFRDLIAGKFSKKVGLCEKITFTGSDNKHNSELGCPDAASCEEKDIKKERFYVEVKTKTGTPLTDFEKESGARHIKVHGFWKREIKCSTTEKRGNRSAKRLLWRDRSRTSIAWWNKINERK